MVYKKTDERHIEWQQVTTNDSEWQRVVQRVTTNDNERYNEWQRVVHRVTINDNEWQRVTKSGTTSKNGTVYFTEWMIAILSLTKIDTLLQEMDGWY